MSTTEPSPQVALARRIAEASADLRRAGADVPRPSDSYAVLGALTQAQTDLTDIYEQLAQWHAAAEVGVHHAGDDPSDESENPSWTRAELALRDAVRHSAAAAVALGLAHTANGVASWFDEILSDAG